MYGYGTLIRRRRTRDALVGTGLGAAGLVVATVALGVLQGPAAGGRFLAVAGGGLLAFSAVVTLLERRIRSRAGDQPVTLASWVTLARGALVAAFAGLFAAVGVSETSTVGWLPGLALGLAAALDRVDGWLARTRNAETALGERLDIETDAILVLVGATVVVLEGLAPLPVLSVGLARYLFLAGQGLRRSRGRTAGEESRRWLNRLMYVAMVTALWLAVLPATGAAVTRPLVTAVAVPFLLNFLRSWLAAGQ